MLRHTYARSCDARTRVQSRLANGRGGRAVGGAVREAAIRPVRRRGGSGERVREDTKVALPRGFNSHARPVPT